MGFKFLDLVLLAFLVISVVFGYKKGFFRSVLSLFSLLVVTYVAPMIADAASHKLYEGFVEKKVSSVTDKVLENSEIKLYKRQIDKAIRNLDPISSNILKNCKAFDVETFIANKTNKNVITDIVKERTLKYINFLLTALFSFLLIILLKIFLRRFSLKKLPIIGGVDAILGGTLGFFECLVFVFILFNIFSMFSPFFSGSINDFGIYSGINNSLSFKIFKEHNVWNHIR